MNTITGGVLDVVKKHMTNKKRFRIKGEFIYYVSVEESENLPAHVPARSSLHKLLASFQKETNKGDTYIRFETDEETEKLPF